MYTAYSDQADQDILQKASGNSRSHAKCRETIQELDNRLSIPTLQTPQPLFKQYDGRTLKNLEGGLEPRTYHGIPVSIPFLSIET